ncbi:origin recognition complex, subunit 6 [Scheffersomyces amazonensis]|uniref:origin recognition complex, subunit 6 n=1 Tax=Scheffersomyces amazonensis TaxID=1078765 RepID=UPI00315CFEA7
MSSQLKQSLQDIIPAFHGQLPAKLVSYVDSLYRTSLHKKPVLPNNAAVARYHLCAYLAAEELQDKYNLPEPDAKKIPLQPKLASKLLDDFRECLIRSANSTPNSSPQRKSSTPKATPTRSPTKGVPSASKQTGSPLKRLRQLNDEEEIDDSLNGKNTKTNINDSESIFNPKKSKPSPSKSSPFKSSPSKASPSKSSPKPSSNYRYDKKHVSIVDFITFCNNFYIPADVSPKMIETFLVHKHKFAKKSEWLLACGIVHAAYIRINHTLITSKIGTHSEFINHLFQYQKGGLLKWNLQLWCNIVGSWIKEESWIKDLELKYLFGKESIEELQSFTEEKARIGTGWNLLESFGLMIHGDVLYESDSQVSYYNTWSNKALSD